MSYSHEKIRKQIAGCKVEMCKNENKIKLINCQALKKGLQGQGDLELEVKSSFKWGLLSPIVFYDAAFCSNGLFLFKFLYYRKFHGNCIFLANGCTVEQNSRKKTPLKVKFYFQR